MGDDQISAVSNRLIDGGSYDVDDEANVADLLAARPHDESHRVPLFRSPSGPQSLEGFDDGAKRKRTIHSLPLSASPEKYPFEFRQTR